MSIGYTIVTQGGGNSNDDSDIQIQLGGTGGISPDPSGGATRKFYSLETPGDDFEAWSQDTFKLRVDRDLGDIVEVWMKGSNDDFWDIEWMNITADKPGARTMHFDMRTTIKGDTLHWMADGVDQSPRVDLRPGTEKRYLYTDYGFVENRLEPTDDHRTDSDFTVKIATEEQAFVQQDRSSSRTEEHSWFVQFGYEPSDAGGVSFGAGYAGRVASTVERRTQVSHSKTLKVEKEHTVKVRAGKVVPYQVEWSEIVKSGTVALFDGTMAFKQTAALHYDFRIMGEVAQVSDLSPEYRAKRRV